ncbi:hypothetical protein BD779DRAFT_1024300 [Infundibulicybe gibba]|nr:hypothetical protein BD779DRAFT_1024300 [Infundibulicybe gibba]
MLTRSAAKKAALQPETAPDAAPPSNTVESPRKRWACPREAEAAWSGSSSSLSSLSTLTDSSLESLSDFSSWTSFPPSQSPSDTPTTPPRHTPRRLERSPGKFWFPNGESRRIVLIPDSFSPGATYLREATKDQRMDDVFNEQWEALMRHKAGLRPRGSDDDADVDTDVEDSEMSFDEAVDRAGARQVQKRRNGFPSAPATPKTFGPHGTEIIEEDVFFQQPQRRPLGWEPTELVID